MDKDKREAERAARRARRLAEREQERARRKERQAQRAAERAERLAERVNRRPSRERELEDSIEDFVDGLTQKAEEWIDEQTKGMFDGSGKDREVRQAEKAARRAEQEARQARQNAQRAERAADELSGFGMNAGFEDDLMMDGSSEMDDMYDLEDELGLGTGSRSSRRRRSRRYGYGRYSGWYWGYDRAGRRRRRRGSAHLYRDREHKKIMGVCAGIADYFERPAWEIRLYAFLGLIFVPSFAIPAYFITYFLMDDKPYYRRVTDRFDEAEETSRRKRRGRGRKRREARGQSGDEMMVEQSAEPALSNVEAIKVAKDKFSNIEHRLREMESHVTSSRFELQRELKKISGED